MVKKITKKIVKKTKPAGLSISIMGVDGKQKGTMSIPKEIFGATINKPLMAQAVRVHLANIREGGAATKTRGMVEGSTRKIYRQKGTGRARHGSIRAPIFVGGGVVFGPVPHNFALSMPTKMRRCALMSALTSQFTEGNVLVVDGLGELKPKTKFMAKAIYATAGDLTVLMVLDGDSLKLTRNIRNIKFVDFMPVQNLNTYDILTHQKIVFTKDAVKQINI